MKKFNMLPLKELERLYAQPYTCFEKVCQTLHVTLHPRYLNNLELGLVDYFNKQINRWHPKLNGILANYGKIKLKTPHGMLVNEEAHIHLDVFSDFWVFRPEVGSVLQGIVTKKSQTHVSCLVHGVFNVPCYHPSNLGATPWWGINAQIGQPVRFAVTKMDVSQRIPFILGDLQRWGLDGVPISDTGLLSAEYPVEEVELKKWEQVAGGNESQGECSDADSGIHSLPKKAHPENRTSGGTTKKSKGSKGAAKTDQLAHFQSNALDLLSAIKNPLPPKPPNVDDLIKSIKIPEQQIALPTMPAINKQQKGAKTNGTSPTKKSGGASSVLKQCTFCDAVLTKKNLKNHCISHFKEQLIEKIPSCAPGKTGPFQCPKCELTQKDKTDILRHFANTHNELKSFCTEEQLQGRDVQEPANTLAVPGIAGDQNAASTSATNKKDIEEGTNTLSNKKKKNKEKSLSNNVSAVANTIIKETEKISTTEVNIKSENDSSPKKKKHKKRKSTEAFESASPENTNKSTLTTTNATPIQNPAMRQGAEKSIDVQSTIKKKKKKNKHKDRDQEEVISKAHGIKREYSDIADELNESSPSKKSKSIDNGSRSNDVTQLEPKHSKKKKKKDKV